MGFMTRLNTSWLLFTQSLTVMWSNKKLILFPAITAILTLLIILFFIVPIAFQPTGYKYSEFEHWKAVGQRMITIESLESHANGNVPPKAELTRGGMILIATLYFIAMFLATFFSVAFYHEILRALHGQDVSISRGLIFAISKLPSIAVWSLFAGLVGYLIRLLEEKVGFLGRMILAVIGIAWSVACVFVIPVIIVEESVNPVRLLRESAAALKKTWGEALIGFAGIQFGSLLVGISSFVFLGGMLVLSVLLHSIAAFLIVCVLWVISLFCFSYLIGIANNIYRCALFIYATDGKVPGPFDQAAMQAAWKMKKRTS